jgi:glucokinase
MLLAGDLGGTKTLLGLFEGGGPRPRPVLEREFTTLRYPGVPAMIRELLGEAPAGTRVDVSVIGAAGPVRDQAVELTNVPWRVCARELRDEIGLGDVVLLNDVEAMAHALETLEPGERVVLQEGRPERDGNGALITIGTGVGMAVLNRDHDGWRPVPSEGGHADFAARTEREVALMRSLRPKHGRVDIERVVAGPGLATLARFTHGGPCPRIPAGLAPADEPAHVAQQGMEDRCPACREALDMFVEALGAVCGNLALTAKATGGLFLGGGVPAKILPALHGGSFLATFAAKAPVEALAQSIPLSVVTLPEAGLLGAAVYAQRLLAAA